MCLGLAQKKFVGLKHIGSISRSGERIKRFQMKTINMELERETPPWILVEFGQPMEAAQYLLSDQTSKDSTFWESDVVGRQKVSTI